MPEALLKTWFGAWNEDAPLEANDPSMALWWGKSDAVDHDLRDRFGDAHMAAASVPEAGWEAPLKLSMARILLLDQVPRNIYRGTAHMFATDGLAQSAALYMLNTGSYTKLPAIHRYFALMPLMHSESRALHERATQAFDSLAEEMAGSPRAAAYTNGAVFERKHREIVERFGRYPHRNALLGRSSTPEEVAFLKEPGSSF